MQMLNFYLSLNVTTQDVLINGLPSLIFTNKGFDTVVWNDGIYIFNLCVPSEIGKKELIIIAEYIS